LPPATPPRIRRLIERCLKRDPRQRLRDIGEARIVLDSTEEEGGSPTIAPPKRHAVGALAGWLAAAVMTVILGIVWSRSTRPASRPLQRFSAELGADVTLPISLGSSVALSPDGSRLAFVGVASDAKLHLYTRLLDQSRAAQLPGTDGAIDPFFSPDGEWIGFFADSKLRKIPARGGAAITVCEAPNERGGTWGEDGQITFSSGLSGLVQVSAAGGIPKSLTKLDPGKHEATHRWPQVVPGAGASDQAVLFTTAASADYDNADVEVLSLRNNERKTLVHGGTYGRYLAGRLLYARQGTLFVAPMDIDRLELTGPSTAVVEKVVSSAAGGAQFAFSQGGDLVFVQGKGLRYPERDCLDGPLGKDPAAANGSREIHLAPFLSGWQAVSTLHN
jgi:hypothetical protein